MKRTLWIIIAIAILSRGATVVHTQEEAKSQIIEQWECYDRFKYETWEKFKLTNTKPPVLVRLRRIRLANREYGVIEVSGSKKDTQFGVEGINRRWDFGGPNNNSYSFFIKPNKSGMYVDFTGQKGKGVKPSQFFNCEER